MKAPVRGGVDHRRSTRGLQRDQPANGLLGRSQKVGAKLADLEQASFSGYLEPRRAIDRITQAAARVIRGLGRNPFAGEMIAGPDLCDRLLTAVSHLRQHRLVHGAAVEVPGERPLEGTL